MSSKDDTGREKLQPSEDSTNRPTELLRPDEDAKVAFSLAPKKAAIEGPSTSGLASSHPVFDVKVKKEAKSDTQSSHKHHVIAGTSKVEKQDAKPRKSALDEIMEMEERRKEKQNRKDY
ncbi:unnamed protein product [Gongylonema pulchrum]|uniref:Protein phosphatase inhibitor 2 n=1 Tax=Gongylonema pulchrum TaxID=637853 RepID=A0A183E9T2_9BILA|nr:unnamed protein product [Gongylonema pulchrum]